MRSCRFPAMGTTVEAWYEGSGSPAELQAFFAEAEQALSRFRPDSELNQLNESADESPKLSSMMSNVLGVAQWARSATDGLVDVGVGEAVVTWGYDRTFSEVEDLPTAPRQPGTPGWRVAANRLIREPGTRLDLGGIAKGWAADHAVELGLAAVVSAGGDMRSADEETVAGVVDPWGDTVAHVKLGAGALATTSVTRRTWRVGGRQVSHVIDPRTMRPIESPILSATVVARSAAEAEVGAKAVLMQGEDGLAWGAAQPWIDSVLVIWHDGSVFATPTLEIAA